MITWLVLALVVVAGMGIAGWCLSVTYGTAEDLEAVTTPDMVDTEPWWVPR